MSPAGAGAIVALGDGSVFMEFKKIKLLVPEKTLEQGLREYLKQHWPMVTLMKDWKGEMDFISLDLGRSTPEQIMEVVRKWDIKRQFKERRRITEDHELNRKPLPENLNQAHKTNKGRWTSAPLPGVFPRMLQVTDHPTGDPQGENPATRDLSIYHQKSTRSIWKGAMWILGACDLVTIADLEGLHQKPCNHGKLEERLKILRARLVKLPAVNDRASGAWYSIVIT